MQVRRRHGLPDGRSAVFPQGGNEAAKDQRQQRLCLALLADGAREGRRQVAGAILNHAASLLNLVIL